VLAEVRREPLVFTLRGWVSLAGLSDNAMRDGPTHIRFRLLLIVVCGSLLAVALASGLVAIQLRRSVHAQELAIAHTLADCTQMLVGLWVSVQEYRQAV
jgi:hypothetical protein